MILLHLSLSNPWAKENFKNLFCRSGMITKHKAWEFEVCRHAYDIVKIDFQWSVKSDHAGPSLELCLFGYGVEAKIYDTRHWNRETNSWEVYE